MFKPRYCIRQNQTTKEKPDTTDYTNEATISPDRQVLDYTRPAKETSKVSATASALPQDTRLLHLEG